MFSKADVVPKGSGLNHSETVYSALRRMIAGRYTCINNVYPAKDVELIQKKHFFSSRIAIQDNVTLGLCLGWKGQCIRCVTRGRELGREGGRGGEGRGGEGRGGEGRGGEGRGGREGGDGLLWHHIYRPTMKNYIYIIMTSRIT